MYTFTPCWDTLIPYRELKVYTFTPCWDTLLPYRELKVYTFWGAYELSNEGFNASISACERAGHWQMALQLLSDTRLLLGHFVLLLESTRDPNIKVLGGILYFPSFGCIRDPIYEDVSKGF